MTRNEALKIAFEYLQRRNRSYSRLTENRVQFIENNEIAHGKLRGENRDVWIVNYEEEGAMYPQYFIAIDAETGKVLYTLVPRGYAEDWEEEGFEQRKTELK